MKTFNQNYIKLFFFQICEFNHKLNLSFLNENIKTSTVTFTQYALNKKK